MTDHLALYRDVLAKVEEARDLLLEAELRTRALKQGNGNGSLNDAVDFQVRSVQTLVDRVRFCVSEAEHARLRAVSHA